MNPAGLGLYSSQRSVCPAFHTRLRAAVQADWNVTSFARRASKSGECALSLDVMQAGGESAQILGGMLHIRVATIGMDGLGWCP